MTFDSILKRYPVLVGICERELIGGIDTLKAVLADPPVAAHLGIPAGPLATLRAELLFASGATIVEIVDPWRMPLVQLLTRAKAGDPTVLQAARGRVLRLVTTGGPGVDAILVEPTVSLINAMGDVDPRHWPARYQSNSVRTWDHILPIARPWFCPFTDEPVVEGKAATSGHDYTGVSDEKRGLLAFLATKPALVTALGVRGIIEHVKKNSMSTESAFDKPLADWGALPKSGREHYAESIYSEPLKPDRSWLDAPVQSDQSGGTLVTALLAHFTSEDLRTILGQIDRTLKHSLPGPDASPARVAAAAVDVCHRYGARSDLVEAAVRARPRIAASVFRNAR